MPPPVAPPAGLRPPGVGGVPAQGLSPPGVGGVPPPSADRGHVPPPNADGEARLGPPGSAPPPPRSTRNSGIAEPGRPPGKAVRVFGSLCGCGRASDADEPQRPSKAPARRGSRQRTTPPAANGHGTAPPVEPAKPAEETIIIFDWDDTLLPTSWLASELGNDVQVWPHRLGALPLEQDMQLKCAEKLVAALLEHAHARGYVVILTNASRLWLNQSLQIVYPALIPQIQAIPMVFAGDFATKELGTTLEYLDYYTELKRQAFQRTVHDFYSMRGKKKWQHVISVGDGIFEFLAVRQVVDIRRQARPRASKNHLLNMALAAGLEPNGSGIPPALIPPPRLSMSRPTPPNGQRPSWGFRATPPFATNLANALKEKLKTSSDRDMKLKVVRFQERPTIERFVQELEECLHRFDEIIASRDLNYIFDLNEVAFGDYVPEPMDDPVDEMWDGQSDHGSNWSQEASSWSWGSSGRGSREHTPRESRGNHDMVASGAKYGYVPRLTQRDTEQGDAPTPPKLDPRTTG